MLRKTISLILSIILLVSCILIFDIGSFAVNYTNEQAVAWAQSQIGKELDYDNVAGAQCVDLIKYYYEYLGVTPVRGNGCDYATNALPKGWARIPYSSDLVVQPGDIAVWTVMSSTYGHVAIVESVDDYGMNVIDQSKNYTPRTKRNYFRFNVDKWTFYGVIRPNFIDKNKPVISDVSVSTIASTGFEISFKATDNAGIKKVLCPTWTANNGQDDINWNERVTRKKSDYTCTVSIANHNYETGNYKTDIYVYDTSGNVTVYNIDSIVVPVDEDGYKGYPDVFVNTWYYDGVRSVTVKKLMSGYSNGKFGPADDLKRQDFVCVLARLAGVDLKEYEKKTNNLTDVKPGAYYYSALNWATENKIVSGYENGKFGVGDKITREQVCTILYRFMDSPEIDDAEDTVARFSDKDRISGYAVVPIAWAVQNKIVGGNADGTVAPVSPASRAQIAIIINGMSGGGMI